MDLDYITVSERRSRVIYHTTNTLCPEQANPERQKEDGRILNGWG